MGLIMFEIHVKLFEREYIPQVIPEVLLQRRSYCLVSAGNVFGISYLVWQ